MTRKYIPKFILGFFFNYKEFIRLCKEVKGREN